MDFEVPDANIKYHENFEKARLKNENRELEKNMKKLETEKKAFEMEIKKYKEYVDVYKNEVAELKVEIEWYNRRINDLENYQSSQYINDLQKGLTDLQKTNSELKRKLQIAESNNKCSLCDANRALARDLERQKNEECMRLTKKCDDLNRDLLIFQNEIKKYKELRGPIQSSNAKQVEDAYEDVSDDDDNKYGYVNKGTKIVLENKRRDNLIDTMNVLNGHISLKLNKLGILIEKCQQEAESLKDKDTRNKLKLTKDVVNELARRNESLRNTLKNNLDLMATNRRIRLIDDEAAMESAMNALTETQDSIIKNLELNYSAIEFYCDDEIKYWSNTLFINHKYRKAEEGVFTKRVITPEEIDDYIEKTKNWVLNKLNYGKHARRASVQARFIDTRKRFGRCLSNVAGRLSCTKINLN